MGGEGALGLSTSSGSYDPAMNTWSPLNDVGAPAPRTGHTAVWTGSEMIIWGGESSSGLTDSGAMYQPVGDTWRPIPAGGTNPPAARQFHGAVWTGTSMIVWGGTNGAGAYYDTGGIYVP